MSQLRLVIAEEAATSFAKCTSLLEELLSHERSNKIQDDMQMRGISQMLKLELSVDTAKSDGG